MASEPHPDVQELLDVMDAMDTPQLHEMSVADARTVMDEALAGGGDAEPVGDVTNRTIPGPDGELSVRIYLPEGDGPFPTVVYFHGGGFVVGDLDGHDSTCRRLTNAADAAVVSVNYRLAPEHPFPAAVEDADAATRWAAENAATFGGDPDRLVVAGDSSGGNLAAVAALMARDRGGPEIAYQLLVYPAVSFDGEWPSYEENGEGYFLTLADMEWFDGHYMNSDVHARNPYAAPMQACDLGDLPPATVITAGFDPLRDEGRAYADRLAEEGTPVTHRNYEGMIHGFFSMLDEPFAVERADEAIADAASDLRDAV
jgi:acetyl esterase